MAINLYKAQLLMESWFPSGKNILTFIRAVRT